MVNQQAGSFEAVILAAGMGTRLGRPHPKPLTTLSTGETIMRRQVAYLREEFGADLRITAVIGFKLDLVIEANADLGFAYNPFYDTTNTNKSLLKALQQTGPSGILWFNGDVVFDRRLLGLLRDHIASDRSFVAVNTESVAEEEVKYTLGDSGGIKELSKTVVGGQADADPAPRRVRGPGLLRARHRARDREGRPAYRGAGHLGVPLRRGRHAGRPRPGQHLCRRQIVCAAPLH